MTADAAADGPLPAADPTNPLTEARQAIAAALVAAVPDVTVYSATPEAVTTPAVLLAPGDPWCQPLTWTKTAVRIQASLLTHQGTNEAAAQRLEEMAWAVVAAARALGGQVGEVTAPRSAQYGASQVLVLDIPITVHVDD